jgi:hypothetical protein
MVDKANSMIDTAKNMLSGKGIGGGLFGKASSMLDKFFGGFFANGGYLPQGRFGIVGERGPEMISGPANITPGGGGRSLQVTINAVDAASFQSLVASDPEFIYSVAAQGARSFK